MKYQHHESVKIVWYEDVKKDMVAKIKDIGEFIGFHVPEPKIESLVSHMRIDNFKKNDAVNLKPAAGTVPEHVRDNHSFIRKGIVGDGKGHFVSPEVEEEFDNWVRKNNKDDEGITYNDWNTKELSYLKKIKRFMNNPWTLSLYFQNIWKNYHIGKN